jgi:hypothetical protein
MAKVADYIFLTDRDDKEILESLERMWGIGNPVRLKAMREDLDKWRECDESYYMYYNLIADNTIFAIRKMIEWLNVDVDELDILKKFESIEMPENGQDPVTLFFPNHISEPK